MVTILIIDDDPDLCTLVRITLTKAGYQVEAASNGRSGLEKAIQIQPDLILLDIMMPDGSGWDVCQQLREVGDAPIIFLSAKGSEGDIVRGLGLGADDYVSKPFRSRELAARIEAVLRRSRTDSTEADIVYRIGDLAVDKARWQVRRGDEPIHVTPTEFRLLLLLAKHAGRPVAHQDILTEVWGTEHKGNLNLLKVYVRQVRQKVERDPDQPQYLVTKRGIGYQLG